MPGEILFRETDFSETEDLRTRVLGWRNSTIELDTVSGTAHFVAESQVGAVIGCASVGPSEFPEPQNELHLGDAMRFWGVAVLPPFRGKGIGDELMNLVQLHARTRGAQFLWANARESAVSFYLRRNFTVIGEKFTDSLSGLTDFRVGIDLHE